MSDKSVDKPVDMLKLVPLEELNRKIAIVIGTALKTEKLNVGFALLMFSFDGPELTWVSNAERQDMIKALKEFIEKVECGEADELGKVDRLTYQN